MKTVYNVIAGTWEEDIDGSMYENIKYCKSFDTQEEADAELLRHSRRPIAYIQIDEVPYEI